MARVVHFEIYAENTERAIEFYTRVFGWKFGASSGSQDYWLITTGPDDKPGINGGLMRRRGTIDGQAVIGYVCTVETLSVDESVSKVLSAGGQNILPKMAIRGVGWLAYCKDTEGNIFGVMNSDPAAR